jgi:hypothetical protein
MKHCALMLAKCSLVPPQEVKPPYRDDNPFEVWRDVSYPLFAADTLSFTARYNYFLTPPMAPALQPAQMP